MADAVGDVDNVEAWRAEIEACRRLAEVAAVARQHGITTTTVGIGMGYDELLLSETAHGGQGSHVFAEHGDGAAAAVAGEGRGPAQQAVQAASLIIRPNAAVTP